MSQTIYRPLQFGKETFHAIRSDEHAFVMDWTVAKGGKVPSHFHRYMDEHFEVTEGALQFHVNGEKILKQQGESFFVPKGIVHSVANAQAGNSSARVTYSPGADTGRMFEIIAYFDESKPGSMMNMIKYMYLAPRLGLREFSTVHPPLLMAIFRGMVQLFGFFGNWKKLEARWKR